MKISKYSANKLMNDELIRGPLKETIKTTLKGHQREWVWSLANSMGLCCQQNVVWVWLLAQFLCAVSSDKGLLNRAPLRGVPHQFPTAMDGFLEIRNLSPQRAVCHYYISRISALLCPCSSAAYSSRAAAVLFMSSPQHSTFHAVAHTCWACHCHGCFARKGSSTCVELWELAMEVATGREKKDTGFK